MSDYLDFLATKRREWAGAGLTVPDSALPARLFPFQRVLTRWALRKGRAAIWADTGLGKSLMQTAWAAQVPGRVLILAPLCVAPQTIREAAKSGIEIGPLGSGERIEITNYERLHQINPAAYVGVVADESSILKAYDGKTRTALIQAFQDTPYRLCCTATPAPNDVAELANHAEFLGLCSRQEMLATWFVHDETGWRLKGHAHQAFYRWLASWGLFVRRPSDLGFDDTGFVLPPLAIQGLTVESNGHVPGPYLFSDMNLGGIGGRAAVRRTTVDARVQATVDLVQRTPGAWIVWCGLNDEQDAMAAALGDEAVSVAGQDSEREKTDRIEAFITGRARIMLSKVRVTGFGLNLQHCHQMVFLGLNDSWEQYYQAIRRCWRFGQTQPVAVHIVTAQAEQGIVENVYRKDREATATAEALVAEMREIEKVEVGMTERTSEALETREAAGAGWRLINGDTVDVLPTLPQGSVDLTVTSPPFIALYTYTASERDLGNSAGLDEFLAHFRYVAERLLWVTKPGRLAVIHCQQVALTKAMHGVIGLQDFRGAVIRLFTECGWIYHGEVCCDRNPQSQAIRRRVKGLAFQQLHKDASWMRPALADYLCLFRAPGENVTPVKTDLTNEDWIAWAHPVWYGMQESDTLSVHAARESDDDRHLCPLQLWTIHRAIRLWSNPGDTVLDPFAGIGSTLYEALRLRRHGLGIELKSSYWNAAAKTLADLEQTLGAPSLFSERPA